MKKLEKKEKCQELLELGNQLVQRGHLEQAIEKYQQALEINDSFFPVLNQIAKVYVNRKEFDRAVDYYKKALRVKPNNYKTLCQLAEIYSKALSKKNDINEAMAVYEEIIDISEVEQKPQATIKGEDKVAKFHEQFGKLILKLSIRQSNFEDAEVFFRKSIEKNSTQPWFYYNLALLLAKQNYIDEAVAYYKKALQIQPNFYQALIELGKLFQKNKAYDDAIQCGMKAIDLNPNPRAGYDLLTNPSSELQGILTSFLQDKVRSINPSQLYKGGVYNLYHTLGQHLKENGNLSGAISLYQKCIYFQLQKTKPDFVSQYWENSQIQDPNFLIIGVGKCGTTALYDYLVQHPRVLPAIVKEPCYLSSLNASNLERKSSNPVLNLQEERNFYLAHFPPRPNIKLFVTGEASVNTIHAGIENLVYSWFPKIKLIVILRNPVKRAISHYEQGLKGNLAQLTFEKTVLSELEILEKTDNLEKLVLSKNKNLCYLHKSLYLYLLKPWINLFGKDRILVLLNEDLARNPADVMNQVFNFIELPEHTAMQYSPRNVGHYPSNIDCKLIERLTNFYKPHNQKLEEYLGRKFNW